MKKKAASFDRAESIFAQKAPLFYYEPHRMALLQVGKSEAAQAEQDSFGLLLLFSFVSIVSFLVLWMSLIFNQSFKASVQEVETH